MKWQNRPLNFSKMTILVLGVCNFGKYQILSLDYHMWQVWSFEQLLEHHKISPPFSANYNNGPCDLLCLPNGPLIFLLPIYHPNPLTQSKSPPKLSPTPPLIIPRVNETVKPLSLPSFHLISATLQNQNQSSPHPHHYPRPVSTLLHTPPHYLSNH